MAWSCFGSPRDRRRIAGDDLVWVSLFPLFPWLLEIELVVSCDQSVGKQYMGLYPALCRVVDRHHV